MDKTPKGKSLRFVKAADSSMNDNSKFATCSSSTPVKETKKPKMWDQHCDSNQGNEKSDVGWDWDSPKNIKPKVLRTRKREVRKSPKVKPKKKSQTDHIKNFEKLREELQALKNEIAKIDDDCPPLSPIDEQMFKNENCKDGDDEINQFIEEQYYHIENQEHKNEPIIDPKNDDWFDETCDEQLFLCSQMIEEKLKSKNHKEQKKINENNLKNIINFDDSFDAVLKEFKDEDIEVLTQNVVPGKFRNSHTNSTFKRTHSDANVEYNMPKTENKINIQRTFSFESPSDSNLPKHVIDEIEKKRLEALEKLRKKKEREKFQNNTSNMIFDDCNNIQCSIEEIEKKRLQAKAIREAKQKEIIEKNRKEALKRLEMNRLKRIMKKN